MYKQGKTGVILVINEKQIPLPEEMFLDWNKTDGSEYP
jgi:hypothetical protein